MININILKPKILLSKRKSKKTSAFKQIQSHINYPTQTVHDSQTSH